ncbi:MAG: pyridoxal-5'-phosphate-dependent protein [Gammaproteobacteria bacterium]|nr:pyridoxal-5'-phosphate-dependent protein [Gammaproteobacteria bacterium]|tara:strand:+ start:3794 stop:4768 length:975 start_codon:yes stop_codon:yes gene_type:complete
MVNISKLQNSYLRIKEYIHKTPILVSESMNSDFNAFFYLKNEVDQVTGSFKIRGALSALSNLKEKNVSGVVAYSSGNHAQGVSKAAQIFGMHAIIVMPEDAPQNKIEKTRANGAEVVLYKRHVESREEIAKKIADDNQYPLVKPFDNEDIIAGQGSFGLEACEYFIQNNISPDIVLSCTSGGGLVAGTSIAFKHYFPDVQIYPVEPLTCNDTEISLKNRTRTRLKTHQNTICDALEVEIPGEITFPINLQNCTAGISVTDEEVCVAMKYLYNEFSVKAEPSGCVSLAAVLSNKINVKGKHVLITISGGNVDEQNFSEYLKLAKD